MIHGLRHGPRDLLCFNLFYMNFDPYEVDLHDNKNMITILTTFVRRKLSLLEVPLRLKRPPLCPLPVRTVSLVHSGPYKTL